jgi:hypothetical protein
MKTKTTSWGGEDVIEFRNCPFCKGRPNVLLVPSKTVDGTEVYVAECQDMGCLIPRTKGRATWAELLAEWNRSR